MTTVVNDVLASNHPNSGGGGNSVEIGTLASLTTTNKSTLVGAINEVAVTSKSNVSASTSTAIVSPVQSVLSVVPAANSEGIFFGNFGQTVWNSPFNGINGGHTVGSMGWGVHLGAGTLAMGIGCEGRYDHMNAGQGAGTTTTKASGVLGLLNIAYGTVTDGRGVTSELNTSAGASMAAGYGYFANVPSNLGTMTKYVAYGMPNITAGNIGTKRFFENLDTAAPSTTKSPTIQQDYAIVAPVSGATVTLGGFTSDTLIVPAGPLATLTVALPATPIDGQLVLFCTTQTISLLAITAAAAILYPPNNLVAGGSISFKYIGAVGVWMLQQNGSAAAMGASPLHNATPTSRRLALGNCGCTSATSLAVTANQLYYMPFMVPRRMASAQLGLSVSVGATGAASLGIYDADATGQPNNKLLGIEGVLTTDTSGVKLATAAIVLVPGVLYYAATIVGAAAVTLRGLPVASIAPLLGFVSGASSAVTGYTQTGSGTTLPATASGLTVSSAIQPVTHIVE